MVRSIITVLLLGVVSGCGQQPQVVRMDQNADEALALLASNANDISPGVGIKVLRPHRSKWYVLRDGTCLEVIVSPGDDGVERVAMLTLGEPGRGYGGKLDWLKQEHRSVTELTLP